MAGTFLTSLRLAPEQWTRPECLRERPLHGGERPAAELQWIPGLWNPRTKG